MAKLAGPFGTMPQELLHPGKGDKPNQDIQLNCGELCTHASYKTTKHGSTSRTKEQKLSSFQVNYDK